MKAKVFFLFALSALLLSCNKDNPLNEPILEEEVVTANINNDTASISNDVKTDYNIEGSTAYFHWSGVETIGVMSYLKPGAGSDISQTLYTSTTAATTETSLTFSGVNPGYTLNYAFYPSQYPAGTDLQNITLGWSSSPFRLYIYPNLTYDPEAPLKKIIPMVGKLIDGQYDFVPISSVVAITVKNLPSNAAKITLSSSGSALSGWYRLTSTVNENSIKTELDNARNYGLTVGMASNDANTNGVRSYSFSGLGKGEYTFYFPVSVGTLTNGLTITILDINNSVLQTVSYPKSITTVRGQISKIPLLDLAKATKVAISGNSNEAYIYVDAFGPDATSVKFAVATSEAAASSGVAAGMAITAEGESNKQNIYTGLTDSGEYYLAYSVFDASSNVLRSDVKPVYYLNNTDKEILCGDYTFSALKALTLNNRNAWTDLTPSNSAYVSEGYTDAHMVIAPSNDLSQGTIMLSNFLDFGCEGVTNKSITEEKLITNKNNLIDFQGTYTAGQPLYGTFNKSNYLIQIQSTNPLFLLNGVKYYLHHVQAQYGFFNFETTYTNTEVTLTYGSNSGMCIVNDEQITAQNGSGSFAGNNSAVIFGNVRPVASRTR